MPDETAGDKTPLRVRVLVAAVTVVALPLLLQAIVEVVSRHFSEDWLILAGLTILITPLFVLLPSVTSLVTIGDAFIISIVMIAGTSPAVLAHSLNISCLTLLLRRRRRTPTHRVVFNIALAVINSTLFGTVFEKLSGGASNSALAPSVQTLIIPTFALAITFFLSNSLLVATAIGLTFKKNLFSVWRENYPPLFLDYLVSATAAALIRLTGNLHPLAPLLAAPFVGAIWFLNKLNKAKADEAQRHLREQEQLYRRTVESLALAVDAKDQTTYGHIRRVRAYAMGLAEKLGISDENELKAIETGSLLHDIGKLAIDDYILNKPGQLSRLEFEKMKLHSSAGHEILEQIQFPFPVAECVRSHHERWDGQGYPDGLKGTAIPLSARILAIADSFDAIRSARPYKQPHSTEEAVRLLTARAGSFFDPTLVEVFARNIKELEELASRATEDMNELTFRMSAGKPETHPHAPESLEATRFSPGERVANQLLRLAEFVSTTSKTLDRQEALQVLANRIREMVPYATLLVCTDRRDGSVQAEYVCGKLADRLCNHKVEIGKGISGWVTGYHRSVVNTDWALEFSGLPIDASAFSDTVAVPLLVRGEGHGAIVLFGESPVAYTPRELHLMESIAGIAAPMFDPELRRTGPEEVDSRDPVTGAYCAGYLAVIAAQMAPAVRRGDVPFSILLFEFRNLPHLVRTGGSSNGDAMLRRAADTLRSEMRETDLLVRLGSQTLVALLPGVRSDQALRQAQSLKRKISGIYQPDLFGHALSMKCEYGVSSFPQDGSSVVDLIRVAAQSIPADGRTSQRQGGEADRNILEFPPRA